VIIVHTLGAGRFAFDPAEHTYTVHGDGDLTISNPRRGGMIAAFSRGQWVAVVNVPADQAGVAA
jgi:hypothetical protein